MAKKGRTKSSHHHKSTTHRKIAFIVSVLLIGFMLWTVLSAVAYTDAHGSRSNGKFCAREGRGVWFSFCKVGSQGKGNSCGEGCTCTPFMKNAKWGICKKGSGGENPKPTLAPCKNADEFFGSKKGHNKPCDPRPTKKPSGGPQPTAGPQPTNPPGGSGACNATCTQDSECTSGYCHPAGFELCPTAEPGQPIEDCQFIPPDPTAPNVCMPAGCKTDASKCSCPANAAVQPEPTQSPKYIFNF